MNMNKEYRKELRALKAQEREIARTVERGRKAATREIEAIERRLQRESRLAFKAGVRINKRRAVLEGRLS
jgi:hypothetical protein